MEGLQSLKGLVLDINFDFPAFVLLLSALIFAILLWVAQRRHATLDLAEMLMDENGKASSSRMASFICLGISSWGIMYMLVKAQGTIDTWIFLGYVGIWSGAKAVEKAIDAYALTRGARPPAPFEPQASDK